MKKIILATVVLVGVLTTGAFAYAGHGNCNGQGMKNQQGMQHKMQKRGNQIFSSLNLTQEQKFKISVLRDDMKLEMKKLKGINHQSKMLKFIGDNGFSKKDFIKQSEDNHAKVVSIRANYMEKIFKILTKKQIVELKKNLNS